MANITNTNAKGIMAYAVKGKRSEGNQFDGATGERLPDPLVVTLMVGDCSIPLTVSPQEPHLSKSTGKPVFVNGGFILSLPRGANVIMGGRKIKSFGVTATYDAS